ncbi:MAG: tRNA (adenosine(37)-N6)-dimethylallyltransferase MiaA [Candidatus Gracilibacteria bacterium]|nr:tRNA (adenosine(37)-N6)-dimethylallyltransferase MiaA [Candidatus Gracilibacteria bacterium]
MEFENEIDDFLKKKSEKQKIIVIYGPTACGKTGYSLSLAKYLKTDVISTDSRQIYKFMNIGTGKITDLEMGSIPHHLLDIIDPDRKYSVGEYRKEAVQIIDTISSTGKIPILCGGTGLYIDSIIYDFDIPKVPADLELRKQLENEAKENGNDFVYQKLCEIDPEYAKELHPNNVQYVIRAIEVKKLTGKSKKDFRTEKKLQYDTLFITPYDGKREHLYGTINSRVQQMFEDGLVEEVKKLRMNYSDDCPGLQTIGYKEVVDYLNNNISLEECIFQVQQHNRNYAKRQLTWFQKYNKYH